MTKTPYGDLDITINLSKPEKDPKAIAAAKLAPQSAYPKCQLCVENEGYAGRMNHPARENHRIIPLTINDSALESAVLPLCLLQRALHRLQQQAHPHEDRAGHLPQAAGLCRPCSPTTSWARNADLPIVGGSILSHDHFQGGHYDIRHGQSRPSRKPGVFPGFEDVEAGIVHWPMSVHPPDLRRMMTGSWSWQTRS